MVLLVILFLLTAMLYASVGFGGGSTYNALLVLHGVDYRILPAVALVCNIIVVSGGVWRFSRAGHISFTHLAPWMVASIPAAWLGGRIPISETVFIGVLGLALLGAGLHLILAEQKPVVREAPSAIPIFVPLLMGTGIGFVSGLVGIGGGIFLAPVLYFLRWGSAKQIAAACSFFILVNSLSGLTGQLMKLEGFETTGSLVAYWPHFIAVFVGGQIGSRLAIDWLSPQTVKRLTAVLILFVALRLLMRWLGLVA